MKKEFLHVYIYIYIYTLFARKCFDDDKMESLERNEWKHGFKTLFLATNYSRGVTLRESENRVCNFHQEQDN